MYGLKQARESAKIMGVEQRKFERQSWSIVWLLVRARVKFDTNITYWPYFNLVRELDWLSYIGNTRKVEDLIGICPQIIITLFIVKQYFIISEHKLSSLLIVY